MCLAMEIREQLQKDAARARRLAERASDHLAQELIEIAEQLERLAERDTGGEVS